MTRDQLIRLLAQLLQGLMVPYSIRLGQLGAVQSAFGTGAESLTAIFHALGTFGYPDAEEWEKKLRAILDEPVP